MLQKSVCLILPRARACFHLYFFEMSIHNRGVTGCLKLHRWASNNAAPSILPNFGGQLPTLHTRQLRPCIIKVTQSRNVSFKAMILPKNEQTNSFFLLNSTKNEFVCSFFGRIRGCQKVLSKSTDL